MTPPDPPLNLIAEGRDVELGQGRLGCRQFAQPGVQAVVERAFGCGRRCEIRTLHTLNEAVEPAGCKLFSKRVPPLGSDSEKIIPGPARGTVRELELESRRRSLCSRPSRFDRRGRLRRGCADDCGQLDRPELNEIAVRELINLTGEKSFLLDEGSAWAFEVSDRRRPGFEQNLGLPGRHASGPFAFLFGQVDRRRRVVAEHGWKSLDSINRPHASAFGDFELKTCFPNGFDVRHGLLTSRLKIVGERPRARFQELS